MENEPSTLSVSVRVGFVVIALILTIIGVVNDIEPLRVFAVILVCWFFYIVTLFIDLYIRPTIAFILDDKKEW